MHDECRCNLGCSPRNPHSPAPKHAYVTNYVIARGRSEGENISATCHSRYSIIISICHRVNNTGDTTRNQTGVLEPHPVTAYKPHRSHVDGPDLVDAAVGHAIDIESFIP